MKIRVTYTVDVTDTDLRGLLIETAREWGLDFDNPTERKLLNRLFTEYGRRVLNDVELEVKE